MKTISVVMCAHNAEDTIADSIESVLKQSFPDFELIIVNNGSTDSTKAIIHSYDDKRIRIIDNIDNHIESLNIGIKASIGKYIARMDSDDIMHVDRLKLQHAVMENFSDITVCSCWEIIFGKNIPRRMYEQKFCGLIEQPLVQLLQDNVRISPIYMMRKSFINEKKIQFEDYSYAEDYKLWSEIAKSKGIFYMDSQPLVYSRICDTKISRKRRDIQIQNISKIKKEIAFSLCYKLSVVYPMLIPLYQTNIDLLKEELISEKDFFSLFYSLFMKNTNRFKDKDN